MEIWDEEVAPHAAEEFRLHAGGMLNPYDQDSFDAEDAAILDRIRQTVSPLLEEFEANFAQRQRMGPLANIKVSELAKRYFRTQSFNRRRTEKSYKSAVEKFVNSTGDLKIGSVDRRLANYVVEQLGQQSAQNTLQRDIGVIRRIFSYAVDNEYIFANPFSDISIKGKGRPARKGIALRRSQLEKLFEVVQDEEDRLCLEILAATGMRLDEAALLDFSDIKVEGSIRFFDLTKPTKLLKNEASSREIPVHPALKLPEHRHGRLFSYSTDADGKAQSHASKRLMKYVKMIREDPADERINVHSLRHTFKDLLRDAGVPMTVQNYLMGHKESGQGGDYGSGPSLETKAKWLSRIDISFIQ